MAGGKAGMVGASSALGRQETTNQQFHDFFEIYLAFPITPRRDTRSCPNSSKLALPAIPAFPLLRQPVQVSGGHVESYSEMSEKARLPDVEDHEAVADIIRKLYVYATME